MNQYTFAKKMISGFKGIFRSWLRSVFTRKKKANIFKMWRIMLQCREIFMFKPCAGFEVINGREDFLVFTEPSRKNRQRRQSQTSGALAFRQNWCWRLTLLLLNNYKKPQATKNANFTRLLIVKCSQGAVVTRMVLSLTVLKCWPAIARLVY